MAQDWTNPFDAGPCTVEVLMRAQPGQGYYYLLYTGSLGKGDMDQITEPVSSALASAWSDMTLYSKIPLYVGVSADGRLSLSTPDSVYERLDLNDIRLTVVAPAHGIQRLSQLHANFIPGPYGANRGAGVAVWKVPDPRNNAPFPDVPPGEGGGDEGGEAPPGFGPLTVLDDGSCTPDPFESVVPAGMECLSVQIVQVTPF